MRPNRRAAATPLLALAVAAATAAATAAAAPAGDAPRPFRVTVVDSKTGRGVPLVELATVHHVTWVTDSAGVAALDEPGLFGRDVFLHVRSHGYSHPKDVFGFAGVRLRVEPGGSARIAIERANVAERLYRVTGAGIYRDSVLLGDAPPIREPLLAAEVVGQDSVQVALYRRKLRWFWGDTSRAAYPLGNFAVSGATSEPPGLGGLDPSIGVDLAYLTDEEGFARRLCPIEGGGAVWIDGLVTTHDATRDATVRERMLAHYVRVKSLDEVLERGIVEWDDEHERFVPVRRLPIDAPLHPAGHGLRVASGGATWWYFATPYPLVRAPDDAAALADPARYEAFTCLRHGSRWDAARPALERDAAGRLVWGWKRDTAPVGPAEEEALVRAGLVQPGEALCQLRDVETGRPVRAHSGSVHWNAHRGRWVMIAQELGGASPAGEVWFAEADTPVGPWAYARKVVTHDRYSFYNVAQHPWFDQEGGRLVYFEGTYSTFFSGAPAPTPRYDYNQVMYRLDLGDPRLALPAPVYRLRGADGAETLAMGAELARTRARDVAGIAHFALPPGPKPGAREWPSPFAEPILDPAAEPAR